MPVSLIAAVQKRYRELCIPWGVHFELTYRCNLDCCHCYVVDEEEGDELTYQEIIDILKQLQEMGTVSLGFSGGEIFLREDLLEIIRFAKENFAVILLTNGTLITPAIVQCLKEIRITQVEISLYGASPEVHDAITGVPGSHRRTINTLGLLQREQIPTVIKSTMMKGNIHEYEGLKEIARRLGARLSIGPMVIPRVDGSPNPLQYRISEEDWKRYLSQWAIDKRLNLGRAARESLSESQLRKKNFCNAGRSICSISPQGLVYPCVLIPRGLGSLRENSFKEIWQTAPPEELREIRAASLSNLSQCVQCDVLPFCTPCLGVNYLGRGDIFQCSAAYCRLAHWLCQGATPPERR